MVIAEEEKKKDEEMDRQAILAEHRQEQQRLLQEEQQREKMERVKAVEGKKDDCGEGWSTNRNLCSYLISNPCCSNL